MSNKIINVIKQISDYDFLLILRNKKEGEFNTYFSLDDLDFIKNYHWHLKIGRDNTHIYVARNQYVDDTKDKQKRVYLHREIFKRVNPDFNQTNEVDHINLNKLDNRRNNLRESTKYQNRHNRTKYRCNSTGFKGVSFNKKGQNYQSEIQINNERVYLGAFNSADEAAIAYQEAALKYHGNFARF